MTRIAAVMILFTGGLVFAMITAWNFNWGHLYNPSLPEERLNIPFKEAVTNPLLEEKIPQDFSQYLNRPVFNSEETFVRSEREKEVKSGNGNHLKRVEAPEQLLSQFLYSDTVVLSKGFIVYGRKLAAVYWTNEVYFVSKFQYVGDGRVPSPYEISSDSVMVYYQEQGGNKGLIIAVIVFEILGALVVLLSEQVVTLVIEVFRVETLSVSSEQLAKLLREKKGSSRVHVLRSGANGDFTVRRFVEGNKMASISGSDKFKFKDFVNKCGERLWLRTFLETLVTFPVCYLGEGICRRWWRIDCAVLASGYTLLQEDQGRFNEMLTKAKTGKDVLIFMGVR